MKDQVRPSKKQFQSNLLYSLKLVDTESVMSKTGVTNQDPSFRPKLHLIISQKESFPELNTLRTGLLNCLNARSRGLTSRHRASCI